MRRSATVLATLATLCLLRVPDVLAGAGAFGDPPDKFIGPNLNVSVVMEATPTSDFAFTERRFSMTVHKGRHSGAAMFTGLLPYQYGCQLGSPDLQDLQTSTAQRFRRRLMVDWVPFEVIEVLIAGVGDRGCPGCHRRHRQCLVHDLLFLRQESSTFPFLHGADQVRDAATVPVRSGG